MPIVLIADDEPNIRRMVGALLTGVFAQKALNGVADGVLFGNPAQLGIQAVAVGATIAYSGVMSFVLLKLIAVMIPLRATADDEEVGIDLSNHGEEAYVHGESAAMAGGGMQLKTPPARLRSEIA